MTPPESMLHFVFWADDLRAQGLLDDEAPVLDIAVEQEGSSTQTCLRIPIVASPERIEWTHEPSRRTGAEELLFMSGGDANLDFNLSFGIVNMVTFGPRFGQLHLRAEVGYGAFCWAPLAVFNLGGGVGVLFDIVHTSRIDLRLHASYDMMFGLFLQEEIAHGFRGGLRVNILPRPLRWSGVSGGAHVATVGLEPFVSFWTTNAELPHVPVFGLLLANEWL